MAKRGRVSAKALEVLRENPTSAAVIERVQRPDAPYDLTDAQAAVWHRIAADLPADWFSPKTIDLLAQNCRHVVEASRIASLIEQEMRQKKLDLGRYNQLLKMQERESRAITTLMTKMRTTHQSLYDKKLKLDAQKVNKPWES